LIPLRDSQPSYSKPVVTVMLIAVNVLVFLLQLSLDDFTRNDFVNTFGAVPDRLWWPSIFTSMFLHGGWMHLIGNMVVLWVLGDNIEDVLGHGKFLLFYLLCGVAAALLQVAVNPDSRVPMIGASGAIAGVMGAYLVKFPHSKIQTLVFLFVFVTVLEIPAGVMLVYWLVLQFFSGLGSVVDMHANKGGTAWFAHIGGFIAGVALIKLLPTRDRYRWRSDLRW
jgi:membrane associated rhomboid family serine protease